MANHRQRSHRANAEKKRARLTPVWAVIIIDILLIGVALVVFALFHHVIPRKQEAVGTVSQRYSEETEAAGESIMADFDGSGAMAFEIEGMADAAPLSTEMSSGGDTASEAAAETDAAAENPADPQAALASAVKTAMESALGATLAPDIAANLEAAVETNFKAAVDSVMPEAAAAPTPIPTIAPANEATGYFGTKFKDKFTSGEVKKSNSGYVSDDVNVAFKAFNKNGVKFYVADIYIKDISCFQTAFAADTYGVGYTEWASTMCKNLSGVIAINGDQYGARKDGNVIRNGVLYREDRHPDRDVCVLYWDGTLETYEAGSFNAYTAIENGAYQAWNFGPRLLDDEGKAITRFSTAGISGENPRTAIGYYEPGHYCFVVVDGRSASSDGMTLKDLSALMQALGCKRAYNLDGGQTSVMVAGGSVVSDPYNGGRKTSDILLIVDP